MGRRRSGWLIVLAGFALALGLQLAAPVGVPLYDGVVVIEPYRYLHPTGDQRGNPTSFNSEPKVDAGVSPVFAAATTESPPQAQLIAQRDAFVVPSGATTIRVSIAPIDPETAPTVGAIAGNAYGFRVTDADGNPLAPKPCDGCLSIVVRAPEGVDEAVVQQLVGGQWVTVQTLHAGIAAMYQTNPTSLGVFAVVAAAPQGGGVDITLIIAGLGIALIFAAFVGLIFIRARPPAAYPTPAGRGGGRGRLPSKRRGPPRPPGRSDP
jgi:hypothetical protein